MLTGKNFASTSEVSMSAILEWLKIWFKNVALRSSSMA
jgi:hypothetical protein